MLHVLEPLISKFAEYYCTFCNFTFSILVGEEKSGMICPKCMGPCLVNGYWTTQDIKETE